jgi:hypothetical protein
MEMTKRNSVAWSMSSPASGQFSAGERITDLEELENEFNKLHARGLGYLEVRLADDEFPRLTLGFRGKHAIIHLFPDADCVFLLVGDGTVSPGATISVPVMDDLGEFTGDFALSVEHAWQDVRKFLQSGAYQELGEWYEL